MKVRELYIYPIKGMQGTSVQSATVMERGFEHDRRFMLIDETDTFISQRTHPILVLFKPIIENKTLKVHYKEKQIEVSLNASLGNTIVTNLFEHKVPSTEVDLHVNAWFSEIIGQKVRLVKMEDQNIRKKELIKGPKSVEVSFADGYPYLIVGTESLERLNQELDQSVAINRFRANIIVETSVPHIEDSWEDVKIGDTQLFVVKPCARCQVITIDQSTGHKSNATLKALSTYRKSENKIFFGANAVQIQEGIIKVGDEVQPL